jgi:hypothetical protein
LKGKLNTLIDWLQKLKQQYKDPPKTLEERTTMYKYNNILWNGYLQPLKENKTIADVFASLSILSKNAVAPIIPGAPVGPLNAPTVPKPAVKQRKFVGKKTRQELIELQQKMQMLGFELGPGQTDGKWGPYTAKAWDKLNQLTGNRLGVAPAPISFGPSPELIKTQALPYINVLLQNKKSMVDIGNGINIPINAFYSPQTFLKALAQANAQVLNMSGNLDTTENRKKALAILHTFASTFNNIQTKFDLVKEFGEQGAEQLMRQVNVLMDILASSATGVSSYKMTDQPGMEGKSIPYGVPGNSGTSGMRDQSEEIKGMGTLSGKPSSQMSGTMSLRDEIMNLPQLGNFVNSPMQFAAFAIRYWMGQGNNVEGENQYVTVHKVIEFIRNKIANLQYKLMNTPLPDKVELETILRNRYEALDDIYMMMPKGLK